MGYVVLLSFGVKNLFSVEEATNLLSKMCESYPNYVVCPSTITDEVLDAVARYRSRGRLPALSWIHPTNEGTSVTINLFESTH